jgi:hypothetical protein
LPAFLPLDRESGHSGLLSQDVALDALNDGFGRGLSVELLGIVFVVDIVSHSHELSTIVGACQKDDSNTKDVSVRDARDVWCAGLENELVDTDWDRADKERV